MREEHVEVRTGARRDLKSLLRSSVDLLALGVAAIACLLELTVGILPQPEIAPSEAALDRAVLRLREAVESQPTDLDARRAVVQAAATRFDVIRNRPAQTVPATEVTWPADLLEAIGRGVPNEIRFSAPSELTVIAERGFCELRWEVVPGDNVPVAEYIVFRADGALAPREVLRVPGGDRRATDRSVAAGHTYIYHVVALAAGEDLAPEARRSAPSDPVTTVAATDVKVALLDADATRKVARLRVEKWHAEAWWPREYELAEGASVGQEDRSAGVDFRTGQRIAALRFEEREEQRLVEEPVFEPDGRVRMAEGTAVRTTRQAMVKLEVVLVRLEGGPLPPVDLRLERPR